MCQGRALVVRNIMTLVFLECFQSTTTLPVSHLMFYLIQESKQKPVLASAKIWNWARATRVAQLLQGESPAAACALFPSWFCSNRRCVQDRHLPLVHGAWKQKRLLYCVVARVWESGLQRSCTPCIHKTCWFLCRIVVSRHWQKEKKSN